MVVRTFTGRQHDPESQIYYYRGRYFSSTIGRFISRDPIGVRGGINLYSYVQSKAVNLVDPSGLAGICSLVIHAGQYGNLKDYVNNLLKNPNSCGSVGIVGCGANGFNNQLNQAGIGIPGIQQNNFTPTPDYPQFAAAMAAVNAGQLTNNDFEPVSQTPADIDIDVRAAAAVAMNNCYPPNCCNSVTLTVTCTPQSTAQDQYVTVNMADGQRTSGTSKCGKIYVLDCNSPKWTPNPNQ